MIFAESRYETANIVPVLCNDGVYRATVVPTRVVEEPSLYTNHLVQPHDRLDLLAAVAYGDPEFWWVISDANPQVLYPEGIQPGDIIKIPLTHA